MNLLKRFVDRVKGFLVLRAIHPSDEDYVRMAYLVLLRRSIDSSGLKAWRERIALGRFNQQNVIETILVSEEYQSRFAIDIISILHRSRQEWIKTIPRFDRVLDIGGSSPTHPEGALIQLGYPYRPNRIDILDLPVDKQYWGKPTYEQAGTHGFDWGQVSYFHRRAEEIWDVGDLQERIYDGVFLGQAIEHIYLESLPRILLWLAQHLGDEGRLVFDTPNRLLTKIQCPDSLTDPDHKYEYTPAEMEQILANAGFEITRRIGLVHLPLQAASGKYDPKEFASALMLSDDVDACFLFAIEAKPRRGSTRPLSMELHP